MLSVEGSKVSAKQESKPKQTPVAPSTSAAPTKQPADKVEAKPANEADETAAKESTSEKAESVDSKKPAEPVAETKSAKADEAAAGKTDSKTGSKDVTKAAEAVAVETVELEAGVKIEFASAKPAAAKKPNVDAEVKEAVDAFVRNVTLGNWPEVRKVLMSLDKDEADKVYAHLLKSLASAPKAPNAGNPRGRKQPAKPHMTPIDILKLSNLSPKDIQVAIGSDDAADTQATKSSANGAAIPDAVKKQMAGNIVLPPGVSIDQLPPEALAALASKSGGAVPASAAKPAATAKLNHIAALARLMKNSKAAGHDFDYFVERVVAGSRHFGGQDAVKKLSAADLFMKAGMIDNVEQFLPLLDAEETKADLAALKIWSQLALAKHNEKQVAEWQEKAWKINQWIVGIEDIKKADRDMALTNLITLSSKVDKEVGVAWMNESFTETPERGMTILTNLGTQSADMALKAAQVSEKSRLDLLKLQNEAVEKLIKISPDKASSWKQALTLLAQNWLTEAATTLKYSKKNSGRDYMNIDMYGNYYWVNSQQRQQMYGGSQQPRPIKLNEILEVAPSQAWQDLIDDSLHTNLRRTKANLHLRANEEDKAFPYIEQIATSHASMARDLVHEFLRIWTQNHDPNSSKRQRNPYIYSYGFDRKAEAIPLTRSKQERNLEELTGWVERIRKLPIEDVDESLLANAFTTCHSSAEVFKINRFRDVFGELGDLKPDTIAAICEKMRANLSTNWRDIRNQEAKQTNRREPEVQQEVLAGYLTGLQLCEEALASSPDSWKLHLAKATLMYDHNAYAQTVQKSSEFSDRRDAAFEQFQIAAQKYADVVSTLEKKDQSTNVFDLWFYAGLGACDLGKISDKTVPDLKQYALIKNAIESLPTSLADSHMAKFANNLFTRMSPIKPEIKFRYLRGGFEIVGEHPRAWEASNLYDYYRDLVSEIKFTVEIDGDDRVGSEQPFGVYVNILHTTEIERESGGFGKYVQNQNTMMYAFNYGRPTENYRDKFSDSVNVALGEHFEVLNVTFQKADSMKSRPAAQQGWRVSPYAYVLLKPKGPEVDRIAPLKLDLDFLDTSGYVVIPIESPALVVDCSVEKATQRPIADLEMTQTLDERQAGEGKLIVEISASGKGLVPDLDQIIDLEREDFEIVSVDDQGVLPNAFDEDASEIQILSDRSWTVEYRAKQSEAAIDEFAFSEPAIDGASSKFQRYEDADLVQVSRTIELEKNYEVFSWSFLYWLIPMFVMGLLGLTALIYFIGRPTVEVAQRFNMPEDVNPFTVLTLLKDIKARNGISDEKGRELQKSINRIEEFYFGEAAEQQPDDLNDIARSWINQAR